MVGSSLASFFLLFLVSKSKIQEISCIEPIWNT